MSSIPVYTQSPINAATADGVGAKTIATVPTQMNENRPSTNTAIPTATPSFASSYPVARPGAPAMPEPTSAALRYAPSQPTRTTKVDDEGPPPPQPGAVPAPPSSMRSNLPPPPKAGEPMPQLYPPQMSVPPPITGYRVQPPSSSTSTVTSPLIAYPVPLPSDSFGLPRSSLEHPPGYVQSQNASNFSADQRQVQNAQNLTDLGSYEPNKSSSTATFRTDAEGVWDTAKAWALTAGKKLSDAESEVWKRVNGEK